MEDPSQSVLDQLSMDNHSWLRTRWIRLIAHALVLIGIALFVLIHQTMSVQTALVTGCVAGLLISRLAVSWRYETRLKSVFTEKGDTESQQMEQ